MEILGAFHPAKNAFDVKTIPLFSLMEGIILTNTTLCDGKEKKWSERINYFITI